MAIDRVIDPVSVTPSQAELNRWDKTHLWHAFTQMDEYDPLIIESAEGIWLTDIHGKKYLDGVSSLWCNVHGHRHPKLDQAIRDQIDLVSHVTLLGSSNSTTVRLAKKLAELAPGDLQHTFFGSDGASAVEAALKMAFQYWQQRDHPRTSKTRFMALEFAYHGDTIGSVSLGGVEKFHALFRPLLFDVIRLSGPGRTRKSEWDDQQLVAATIQNLRPVFEKHHNDTAGLIVEPLMQGAAGMIAHPPGLLTAIRELCDEFEILLIADEVAVGFGRTGKLFACEHEYVQPDIMCLGKGLTGGYLPLSATIATSEIWSAFLGGPDKTLYHGHTFGGNPLAAAVALANIELFQAPGFFDKIRPTIDRMQLRMEKVSNHDRVLETRQIGLMGGIELNETDARCGQTTCLAVRDKNVLLRPLGNVIVVMPPLCSKPNEIDILFDAIQYALDIS